MAYRHLFLKVLFVNTFFFSCIVLNAQVMWNLKGGFMPVNVQHFDFDSEHRVNWMVGLEMEIPTRKKFNIETGLRYKNEMVCFDYSDNYTGHTVNHLEVPIRLAYKCRLRDNLALRAGIGPYLGLGIDGDCFDPKIGIEPSVALDWKCLSLGLTYNHPFYLAGGGKYKANSGLMLTLGIRFGSNKWKYVGAGLAVAGAVAGTVAGSVYEARHGDNSNTNYSPSNNSSSSSTSYSDSNSSNYNSVSRSQADYRNSNKTSEDLMNNSEKNKYGNYEYQLIHMRDYPQDYDNDQRISIQRAMKSIRTKWEKKGYKMYHSEWEDWKGL